MNLQAMLVLDTMPADHLEALRLLLQAGALTAVAVEGAPPPHPAVVALLVVPNLVPVNSDALQR